MTDLMRATDERHERHERPGGVERPAAPPGRASVWRWLAGGLAAGLAWGVVARLWMRFIADVPEFSWSGTLSILAATTLAGLSLGAVELLRRRGTRVWRVVLVAPALAMFFGLGAMMAPSAVLGGLVVSGRGPRWLRGAALVLAAAPLLMFLLPGPSFDGVAHAVLALAWYVGLVVALAVAWSAVWRRAERPEG